jgi:hypothetical protein
MFSLDQAEPRPQEAADTVMAGQKAWEIEYAYDPDSANGIAKVRQLAIDQNGQRISVIAYFGPNWSDSKVFEQIIATLQIKS